MRILDLLKKPVRSTTLVLDANAPSHWAQQIIEHKGLDKDFKTFTDQVGKLADQARAHARKLSDEHVLATVPDRARTMNAIHGSEYAGQATKLLKAAEFTTLLGFEQEQERYFEANSAFKDLSAKNASVLKEFLHDELKATQATLQQLEDTIIHFTKVLEEKQFPEVRKLQELNLKLQQTTERGQKYEKLLQSLQADKKRTVEKRVKIEEGIKEQKALVRNEQSLQALDKIRKVEEELFKLAAQYVSLCQDISALAKKNNLSLTPEAKKILAELPKDTLSFIVGNAETIKKAFEGITTQLEEENLGTRTIMERLTRLANSVEQDSRTIATSQPDQRALKREMMKDIAALNVYDKTQFLLRAQAEEDAIIHKLTFLQAELDPSKRTAFEQEMKAIAHKLGAAIKSEQQPETVETDARK